MFDQLRAGSDHGGRQRVALTTSFIAERNLNNGSDAAMVTHSGSSGKLIINALSTAGLGRKWIALSLVVFRGPVSA